MRQKASLVHAQQVDLMCHQSRFTYKQCVCGCLWMLTILLTSVCLVSVGVACAHGATDPDAIVFAFQHPGTFAWASRHDEQVTAPVQPALQACL